MSCRKPGANTEEYFGCGPICLKALGKDPELCRSPLRSRVGRGTPRSQWALFCTRPPKSPKTGFPLNTRCCRRAWLPLAASLPLTHRRTGAYTRAMPQLSLLVASAITASATLRYHPVATNQAGQDLPPKSILNPGRPKGAEAALAHGLSGANLPPPSWQRPPSEPVPAACRSVQLLPFIDFTSFLFFCLVISLGGEIECSRW